MIVLGAGMAGLLARAILRDKCSCTVEAQKELPNNHFGILRFRSPAISNALNITFKKVTVIKAVASWRNPIADALAYSKKTNGGYYMRSLLSAKGEVSERWIAPNNFLQQMLNCSSTTMTFDYPITKDFFPPTLKPEPIISTLPMPMLMKLLNYDGQMLEKFPFQPGQVITAEIDNCESYFSLYVPDPLQHFYRASITGNKLIVEFSGQEQINVAQELDRSIMLLGLGDVKLTNVKLKEQRYAKILPIDETLRRKFILWASEKHNVFSLGRFATWRPSLLLDDLINDIQVIQRISESTNYDERRK